MALERLDKILSNAMAGSRKEVTKMIRSGLVTVDEKSVTSPDFKADPVICKIFLNGNLINYKKHYHIMINKPQGVLSATEDMKDKTVLDLISDNFPKKRLFPAGRLDKDTEGFVLLTTDGILGHRVTGPKNNIEKIYFVRLDKFLHKNLIDEFEKGISLGDGYLCKPAKLEIIDESSCHLTISEGKFHQVKRMFSALDMTVIYLKRIKIGEVWLDDSLSLGEYRELTDKEVKNLLK